MAKLYVNESSPKLPKEILQYHKRWAAIAKLEVENIRLAEQIVLKYCPFRVQQQIMWGYGNSKPSRFATITKIEFKGIDSDALDNKWIITVSNGGGNMERLGATSRKYTIKAID